MERIKTGNGGNISTIGGNTTGYLSTGGDFYGVIIEANQNPILLDGLVVRYYLLYLL